MSKDGCICIPSLLLNTRCSVSEYNWNCPVLHPTKYIELAYEYVIIGYDKVWVGEGILSTLLSMLLSAQVLVIDMEYVERWLSTVRQHSMDWQEERVQLLISVGNDVTDLNDFG